MKFTLDWLKEHLGTQATVAEVAAAMTMAGLEVEHVTDPATKLAAFSVAPVAAPAHPPTAASAAANAEPGIQDLISRLAGKTGAVPAVTSDR